MIILPLRPHSLVALAMGTALFPLLAVSLPAQDLPPPQNPSVLLGELDQLAKGSTTVEQRRRNEAISRIQAAASSPSASLELYLAALDATKFSDKHLDFLEWKKKNQELLRHASYQNAAQLQLCYLLLGLRRSEQHDALAQVPETLSYLDSLKRLHFLEENRPAPAVQKKMQAPPPPSDTVVPEAADLIRKPLSGYPVVQWLQIADLLPGKSFEGTAGNYTEILQKNVKEPLRDKKDPRLPEVWDLQISTESMIADSADSQKSETFKTSRLPDLIFGKFKDTAAIGQPNRALNGMMQLIRTYPANPSAPQWIETARGMITNAPAPAAKPSPAQAAIPAAPAASPQQASPSAPPAS